MMNIHFYFLIDKKTKKHNSLKYNFQIKFIIIFIKYGDTPFLNGQMKSQISYFCDKKYSIDYFNYAEYELFKVYFSKINFLIEMD
jgi:hypothetical protein